MFVRLTRKNNMIDFKIDLLRHTDKFVNGCLEFPILKKINFIFGRNGTGKTTIADEIAKQFGSDYSVHVFKDFDGVAFNERLDAVALGTENVEIQKLIDIVDGEIAEINKDVEKPEGTVNNTFSKAFLTEKNFSDQQKKIEGFYIKSAQLIKNLNNPSIASPNYDKKTFSKEIDKAKTLTDDEILANKNIIKADKKPDVIPVELPTIDLDSYLKSTNEVLGTSVKQPESIPELNDNPNKQQFAKTGLDIHEHKKGEICAFCGNKISDGRWAALGNYFNNEVKTLEHRIEAGITKIENELKRIDKIKEIDEYTYYEKYSGQIKQLNTNIKIKKGEYKIYFNDLKKALVEKKDNLFIDSKTITLAKPKDFSEIQKEYTTIVEDNNSFSKNLNNEQNGSKLLLRSHEIQKKLDEFNYASENTSLITLREMNEVAQRSLQDRKNELAKKQLERIELISKTKDEEKIAIKINNLLKNMGVSSFELKLVNDQGENQKGQYQIKGYDGNIRKITALSKGEKNIIAFLYFMFNLDHIDSDNKPKIVVLDDPMTSNDDTMQYIMIGEIQKYYKKIKSGNYFLLLTHNVHFYLNVRPNTAITYKVNGKEISFYQKYGVYHLFSDGKQTTIKCIDNGKNDFKTSYETLWKELVFLYESTDATADLMLNPCRKICETYMNFTKKGPEAFYGENTNAKKLFDVNQHSIDDLEAEQNGKTKPEIKDILASIFKQNGAEEHFNNYWKEFDSGIQYS